MIPWPNDLRARLRAGARPGPGHRRAGAGCGFRRRGDQATRCPVTRSEDRRPRDRHGPRPRPNAPHYCLNRPGRRPDGVRAGRRCYGVTWRCNVEGCRRTNLNRTEQRLTCAGLCRRLSSLVAFGSPQTAHGRHDLDGALRAARLVAASPISHGVGDHSAPIRSCRLSNQRGFKPPCRSMCSHNSRCSYPPATPKPTAAQKALASLMCPLPVNHVSPGFSSRSALKAAEARPFRWYSSAVYGLSTHAIRQYGHTTYSTAKANRSPRCASLHRHPKYRPETVSCQGVPSLGSWPTV
ncbi:hypothetical protein GA0070614_5652 [Micromonospora coxensis]|uniref:Uncharacterized protein n=1 Tax=Micromonospora coxensis TaxID=356852 RepID=A0A1C5JXV6_9ACTN|nr:hypothetical protein GA0070614_5652 [Micromonospora coxensis]